MHRTFAVHPETSVRLFDCGSGISQTPRWRQNQTTELNVDVGEICVKRLAETRRFILAGFAFSPSDCFEKGTFVFQFFDVQRVNC